jgi:hypothetical protein
VFFSGQGFVVRPREWVECVRNAWHYTRTRAIISGGPNNSVSVVVLTCDEAANVAACLESVARAHEVFLVDSLSKDQTVHIAEAWGGIVFGSSRLAVAKETRQGGNRCVAERANQGL